MSLDYRHRSLHDTGTYKTAYTSLNASGNVIAGVANKVIKVHRIKVAARANMEADLNDDAAGNVIDHYKLNDREGHESAFAPRPAYLLKTAAGKPLYCTFSTAGSTTFVVTYTDSDAT